MATESGVAAPSAGSAAQEVDDGTLELVGKKLGGTIAKSTPAESAEQKSERETAEALANETPEEKSAREAEETARANETPEQKTARETTERAELLANETPEEKTAREAEETAEAAANSPEALAAKKLAEENAQFVGVKLKDLPEPVRKRVEDVLNARIGKISADTKAEKARVEAEQTRLAARVEELSGELEEAKKGGSRAQVQIPGVHPLFLVGAESELDDRIRAIEEFEDFADRNRDGFNLPESENHDPKQPTWTAADIRARARELQREKDKVIPEARANFKTRAEKDTALKAQFPALFDRKSDEYRTAQTLAKTMPELRRHADMNELIARLILGGKALAALKPGAAAPVTRTAPIVPRKAPRVPGGGGPAKGSDLARHPADERPAASEAVKNVMKDPSNRKTFESAVGALIADL